MKYTSLFTNLFLLISLTSSTMELAPRKHLRGQPTTDFSDIPFVTENISESKAIKASYNNLTPLHIACQKNQFDIIQEILQKDPQATTVLTLDGQIPLHFAAQYSSKKCINLLISTNKKTINQRDYNGMTPLHTACIYKKFSTIKFLIKKGADITIKNNSQITPLYYIYDKLNRFDDSLCKKMIHKKNKHKDTQFHLFTMAQHYGNTYIDETYIKTLISYGLNIWSRNKQGQTAVDLVCQHHKEFYKRYMKQKLPIFKTIVEQEERLMHIFLRVTSPHIKVMPFKEIFLLQAYLCNGSFPTELIQRIMYFYYALNIETIVAKKYRDNNWTREDYVENKKIIRNLLLETPEPNLLWSAL